jgi:ribonuclease T
MCLKERFRGYYPVVIDVETAGFNPKTDALLEIVWWKIFRRFILFL